MLIKSMVSAIAGCACMFAITSAANAALIVFNDQASFLTQVQSGFYLEDFEGEASGTLSSPHVFTNGTHSFQASAPNDLFIVSSIAGAGQTLSHRNDHIVTLSSFAGPSAVTAIGGFFFPNTGSSVDPNFGMDIFASNGVDSTTVNLLAPLTTSTFVGFISTGPAFTILTMDIVGLAGPPNADTNDFIVGTAVSSIPEPGTLAILGLGLAGLGFARRRKAA